MSSGFPPGFDPAALGAKVLENGPGALLDEVENLLPEEWRQQISAFPLTAVAIGLGLGVWLGMTKSDEIIEGGKAIVSANVAQMVESLKG
ncbi:MAG TPA: hypothetical protein VF846_17540 [Thermoanaerobaculia bacterium]|jgi:hypothetical protein